MSVPRAAVREVAKVFHFEFWLRYYFIQEAEDGLRLVLSPEQEMQMRRSFPEMWELVERLQEEPLSPQLSQQAVGEYLQLYVEGKKFAPNTVPNVLDSKDFEVEMYLFDTWVELHEDQLMEKIYGFDWWMHVYEKWREGEGAKHMEQSLKNQVKQHSSTTVH